MFLKIFFALFVSNYIIVLYIGGLEREKYECVRERVSERERERERERESTREREGERMYL